MEIDPAGDVESRLRTTSAHSGEDFEAGRACPARGAEPPLNHPAPDPLGTGDDRPQRGAARTTAAGGMAAGSPAHAAGHAHPPQPGTASGLVAPQKTAEEKQHEAILAAPWRGAADKLKPVQKEVLACFEERGVEKQELEEGRLVRKPETKYWVKWDLETNAKTTKALNITRLFGELLRNPKAPLDVKLGLCEKMNNAAATEFIRKHKAEAYVAPTDNADADALLHKQKMAKTVGDARVKENARQERTPTLSNPNPKPNPNPEP